LSAACSARHGSVLLYSPLITAPTRTTRRLRSTVSAPLRWRGSGRRSYRLRLRSASTMARAARPPVRARIPSLQELVQPCCSGRDPAIKCLRRPPVPTCGRRQPVSRTSLGAAAFETGPPPAQSPRRNRSAPSAPRIGRCGPLDRCHKAQVRNLLRPDTPMCFSCMAPFRTPFVDRHGK
jgi:hypothetical protein